jgi:hypothetical protein
MAIGDWLLAAGQKWKDHSSDVMQLLPENRQQESRQPVADEPANGVRV